VKAWAICIMAVVCIAAARLPGQPATPAAGSSISSEKKAGKKEKPAQQKGSSGSLLSTASGAQNNEPMTTEIYADNAFFDSNKNMGVFSGHVKVADPRFTLQSEKLTVFVSKGQNQGLERAIAEGDVAVVRDRPDPNGGPPTRSVGRSDKAIYTAATGDVELTGTPRVQEGLNTHIATTPETVMIVNQKGELTTRGPSRTEIRQQPKGEEKPGTKPAASPKASDQ
jgi:lipopolysaccharide transport protein LptA